MLRANVIVNKDFVIGEADPRLFSGFLEHLERNIYDGIYEPGHPKADESGFRADVLKLVREMNMPTMRYPGGNFVSGYRWEDGVGPKDKRPKRLDLAWHAIDTNEVGTDEFVDWCKKAKTEPMLTVNLGTRGPDAARNLVEYCNHPGGTYWSDLRRKHGYAQPHNVRLWCLGNEMDGTWQIGHKTAAEYGRLACETAKVMKMTDPTVELVACGSCSRSLPSYAAWDAEVLEHTFDHVEYLANHIYCRKREKDVPGFLAQSDEMSDFIGEIVAACDYVAARRKSRKRIMLSFDEWHAAGKTMEHALVVGGMLITLLNHADRVKIACLSVFVNAAGPIRTKKNGAAWCDPSFYPFVHASNLGRGTVLRQVTESDVYDAGDREAVPYLTSACVVNPETDGLTVFAVNRSLEAPLELSIQLRAFEALHVAEWIAMRHDDLEAVNTCESPDTVTPAARTGAAVEGKTLAALLEPASWNAIRLMPGAK